MAFTEAGNGVVEARNVQVILAVARAAAQDHDVATAVHARLLIHPEHCIGHRVPLVQHVDQLLLQAPMLAPIGPIGPFSALI